MEKFEVLWTKNAEYDLKLVIDYIKLDSTSLAKEIFFDIKAECESLHYFPKRKIVVPELQQIGIFKYKEIIYKRWRVVFKIENKKVYILLVADSSRNLEDILFQRLIK